MRVRSSLRWLVSCLVIGCSPQVDTTKPADEGGIEAPHDASVDASAPRTVVQHTSGGVSLPWGTELARAAQGTRLISVVVGAKDVELLEVNGNEVVSLTLPKPTEDSACAHHVPTTAAAVDLDQDGEEDLIVHDMCGSYVVWKVGSRDRQAEVVGDWLPSDGPYEYLVASSSGGDLELATGSATGVHFLRAERPGSPWSLLGQWRVTEPPRVKPRRGVTAGQTASRWLVAGDEALFELDPSDPANTWIEYPQLDIAPPNLLPFASFDYLHALGVGACGASFVALGRFAPIAEQPTPQIALRLDLPDDSAAGIGAHELPITMDVAAIASVAPTEGASLIGVLGRQNGEEQFAVFSASPCEPAILLARIETQISTRRPPAPGLGEFASDAPGAVPLEAIVDGDDAVFITYDGYTARSYRVLQGTGEWVIEEGVTEIHVEREDLAFP